MKGTMDLGIILPRRIQSLMRSGGQWEVKYVHKYCNLIVNHLAKISFTWQTSLQIFEVLPNIVSMALQQDKVFNVA
ncbi:hypothetical protein J1N35_022098 [Gossypium stocksii]|uniref:Uncharacterized protein n=1 Tax=Gossypium stocksii TaxID=47602 RepID=A0A9D3VGZ0_9ROSI|nr:hypothetical protein J1N35_022098 [Gossypium stocksii]